MSRRTWKAGPVLAAALLLPAFASAHPPRGIVVDGQGRIFFSDLERVWMVERGRLSLFRPGVADRHVHELAIDAQGYVWGEQQFYDSSRQRWPSAIWRMAPGHPPTYVVPQTTAPPTGSSVWRDRSGCSLLAQQERLRGPILLRRCGNSVVRLFGRPADAAAFRQMVCYGVAGAAFANDGTFYFRNGGTVRRLTPSNRVEEVGTGFSNETFGIAVGEDGALFVAEFARRRVVRKDARGTLGIALRSEAPWGPTGLAFRDGSLFVLEARTAPGVEGVADYRVRRVSPRGDIATVAVLPASAQHN